MAAPADAGSTGRYPWSGGAARRRQEEQQRQALARKPEAQKGSRWLQCFRSSDPDEKEEESQREEELRQAIEALRQQAAGLERKDAANRAWAEETAQKLLRVSKAAGAAMKQLQESQEECARLSAQLAEKQPEADVIRLRLRRRDLQRALRGAQEQAARPRAAHEQGAAEARGISERLAVQLAEHRRATSCQAEALHVLRQTRDALFSCGDQQTCGLAEVRAENDRLEAEEEAINEEVQQLHARRLAFRKIVTGDAQEQRERLQRSLAAEKQQIARLEAELRKEQAHSAAAARELAAAGGVVPPDSTEPSKEAARVPPWKDEAISNLHVNVTDADYDDAVVQKMEILRLDRCVWPRERQLATSTIIELGPARTPTTVSTVQDEAGLLQAAAPSTTMQGHVALEKELRGQAPVADAVAQREHARDKDAPTMTILPQQEFVPEKAPERAAAEDVGSQAATPEPPPPHRWVPELEAAPMQASTPRQCSKPPLLATGPSPRAVAATQGRRPSEVLGPVSTEPRWEAQDASPRGPEQRGPLQVDELAKAEAQNQDLRREIAAMREQLEQQRLRQKISELRTRMGQATSDPAALLRREQDEQQGLQKRIAEVSSEPRNLLQREEEEQEQLRQKIAERYWGAAARGFPNSQDDEEVPRIPLTARLRHVERPPSAAAGAGAAAPPPRTPPWSTQRLLPSSAGLQASNEVATPVSSQATIQAGAARPLHCRLAMPETPVVSVQ